MLSDQELLEKLYKQPGIFWEHMREKRYAQALYCVETARSMALFMELSEKQLNELFGSRQDPDNVIEGLFPEHMVLKAQEWVIFNNQTRQELTWQDKMERERVWREGFESKGISDTTKRH